MVRIGQDWSVLVSFGWYYSRLVKTISTGQVCSVLVRTSKEWPGQVWTGQDWLGLVRTGQDWPKLV